MKESFDVLVVDRADIRRDLGFNVNVQRVATAQPLIAPARADVQIEAQFHQVADAMDAEVSR